MSRYDGLDIYLWYTQRRIERARTVHHIVPASELSEQDFYSPTNLIPVSDESHHEIHAAYSMGEEEKRRMQETLKKALIEWHDAEKNTGR